jgi:hypothetical protein
MDPGVHPSTHTLQKRHSLKTNANFQKGKPKPHKRHQIVEKAKRRNRQSRKVISR